jgi:hypothetical protein
MKKTKVENVSDIKLDFFLKQNKQDIRVVLKPGETSWCDSGTQTKSMILYERKNLIKSTLNSLDTIVDEDAANVNNDEVLDKLHTTEDIEYIKITGVDPPEFTPDTTEESLTPLEKAEKETEEYKKESEKTYKGKKRGRKKKRGPKPGSKRKKDGDSSSTESQS